MFAYYEVWLNKERIAVRKMIDFQFCNNYFYNKFIFYLNVICRKLEIFQKRTQGIKIRHIIQTNNKKLKKCAHNT